MTLKQYKPGSRVQQVWEVFQKSGAQASFDFGLTLNLAANTLKSWMRMFAKNLGQDPSDVKTPKVSGPTKVVNTELQRAFGRRRVRLGNTDLLGYVLEEGPEQCIVQWDNYEREGLPKEHCEIASHLITVTEKDEANGSSKKSKRADRRAAASGDAGSVSQ